jgi:hypothetical protein
MIQIHPHIDNWFMKDSLYYYANPQDLLKYNKSYSERMQKYLDKESYVLECMKKYGNVASIYEQRGILTLDMRTLESPSEEENLSLLLEQLKNEFEQQLELGKNLKCLGQKADMKNWDKNPNFGPYVLVDDVLLNCPTVFKIASLSVINEIATACLRCVPAISSVPNLRLSFANDYYKPGEHHPVIGETQSYHVDTGSPKMLKMFFYLNDVDDEGGPFTYVQESYERRHSGWNKQYRVSDREIEALYQNDKIRRVTGEVGELVIANTNAFHKGLKPEKTDRMMLTLNFNIHEENFRKQNIKVKKEMIENLEDIKKPLIDFMEIVE